MTNILQMNVRKLVLKHDIDALKFEANRLGDQVEAYKLDAEAMVADAKAQGGKGIEDCTAQDQAIYKDLLAKSNYAELREDEINSEITVLEKEMKALNSQISSDIKEAKTFWSFST